MPETANNDGKTRRDIVLLSTADWSHPCWTNKQYVGRELAAAGHRVLYVESLGLRQPSLREGRDMRRIFRRLMRMFRPMVKVNEHLYVYTPFVIPLHRYALVRRINRGLFNLSLRLIMRVLRMDADLLWTYNPITTATTDLQRFKTVVYHCVDNIAAMPGLPKETIEQREPELIRNADAIFTSAPALQDKCAALNSNTHYFHNVAEFEHFNQATRVDLPVAEPLRDIQGVIVGFVGALSDYKVDFNIIAGIAAARPDWTIYLLGQLGESILCRDDSALRQHDNIVLHGPVDYAELPSYLKRFDVVLLPMLINEYTKSVFPMKFFEYLAAGKPLVSTRLPAITEYRHLVRLADDAKGFVAAIEDILRNNCPPRAGIEEAQKHSYPARTQAMMEIVAQTQGER
ncbi:glycosyltransferase [Oceanidesulfovibrio marinus]|uniref:Glycosyltransferase family 1 protein n=1 Tax=Oceanidesulfovibrio marinus TaxID=370038 RepID=A0A6P1ZLS9_9BACT|nr:glycosyltransferase [Oceanidesulfovibrio marinus]TVM36079.1 glycosyltransferase family 1 protein [Oceanidesulfovibrio marinus]